MDKIVVLAENDLRQLIREEVKAVVDSGTHTTTTNEGEHQTFLLADDVMDMTGYSQASIARKIKDGVLPIAKKEGNRNLFDKKVVEELINQGKLKRNKKVQ